MKNNAIKTKQTASTSWPVVALTLKAADAKTIVRPSSSDAKRLISALRKKPISVAYLIANTTYGLNKCRVLRVVFNFLAQTLDIYRKRVIVNELP